MHVQVHRRRPGAAALWLIVVLIALALHFPAGSAVAATGAWKDHVADIGPRYGHVAVRLADGRVLVAGGLDDTNRGQLATAVVYDPGKGAEQTEAMRAARHQPAGALLPDGSVLVTGGLFERSADRYVPALGRWLPAASMTEARWAPTATVLRDGRVLVAGGGGNGGTGNETTASAEIYDPLANRWTPVATMAVARHWHTATLLPDGRVLVIGGHGIGGPLASAEIYDPAANRWTPTGDLSVPRVEHSATLLPGGRVLVTGGAAGDLYWWSSEVFDPVTGQWTTTGDMAAPRAGHSASALPDGTVFVAGGLTRYNTAVFTTELYDVNSGTWGPGPPMDTPRYLHTATQLDAHTVAFVGGWNGKNSIGEVSLYRQ